MRTNHWIATSILGFMLTGCAARKAATYTRQRWPSLSETQEVSTEQVRRILVDGSAIILDTRKRSEYVAGHIPGAWNLDAPPSASVAAVERLVGGDKNKALVLYCNGPFCQASRLLSEQLLPAGFTNVRRYQLGIPIWRALGGATEIELEGILRIYKIDATAVFFDARSAEEFAKGSLPGAHNVPVDKLATDADCRRPRYQETISTHASCCSGATLLKRAHSQTHSARALGTMSLTSPAPSRR